MAEWFRKSNTTVMLWDQIFADTVYYMECKQISLKDIKYR